MKQFFKRAILFLFKYVTFETKILKISESLYLQDEAKFALVWIKKCLTYDIYLWIKTNLWRSDVYNIIY